MQNSEINVLYVEDDADDADFAQMAFSEIGDKNLKLHVITDGEAAANFLKLGTAESEARTPVDMILLDLNIPRVDGKELLRMIKQSSDLKQIPVIILSTSGRPQDINETYHLGCSGYFKKPSSYKEYIGIFKIIYEYWVTKAALPSLDYRSAN